MSLPVAQQQALEIVARSLPGKLPVYLVGGFVRDALLGRESADIDLGTPGAPADAIKMARQVANAAQLELPGYRVSPFTLDPDFGVARVVFNPTSENSSDKAFYLDFAVFNGGSLESDLARRDFTINALALPLDKYLAAGNNLRLEDTREVAGGRADLTGRVIRPVAEQNLIDDPLRMLRGVRLRAQLNAELGGWEFAPGTLELFRKHNTLLKQSAFERIRDELNKTWLAGGIKKSLRALQESGLLAQILPEVANKAENPTGPDLFELTLRRLDWLERLVTPDDKRSESLTLPEKFISLWPEMVARLEANGRERLAVLLWAGLLFEAVAETAAGLVQGEIMSRLRFSRDATERVTLIVQNQARLAELEKSFDPLLEKESIKLETYRLLRDSQPVQIEVLTLFLAQRAATLPGQELANWQQTLTLVDWVARKYVGSETERLYGKPRLIEGRQLMKALKLKPGPEVGQLLREIEEAQAIGQISATEEAVELARLKLAEQGNAGK